MKDKGANAPIGVFDSGFGGISVLAELVDLMPKEHYIYLGDSKNAPYGIKTVEEVVDLSIKACDVLVSKGVKAIVVACNTATSASINILRRRYNMPVIGMEPAVKPALTFAVDKKIVVMATPITLREKKLNLLIQRLNMKGKIVKLPAPELVTLVENEELEGSIPLEQIQHYFRDKDLSEIGAIVLGCTHFIFLKEMVKRVVGQEMPIIDGNLGTAKYLKDVLKKRGLLNRGQLETQPIIFYNSSSKAEMIEVSERLLKFLLKKKQSLDKACKG